MEASEVTAWLLGIAGIITAIGGVVKIVLTRPRLPVAEELMEELDEFRAWGIALASWAHGVLVAAAQAGLRIDPMPAPPGRRQAAGRPRRSRHRADTTPPEES